MEDRGLARVPSGLRLRGRNPFADPEAKERLSVKSPDFRLTITRGKSDLKKGDSMLSTCYSRPMLKREQSAQLLDPPLKTFYPSPSPFEPDLGKLARTGNKAQHPPNVRMPRNARIYRQNEVYQKCDSGILEAITGLVPELFFLQNSLELRFDFARGDLLDLHRLLPNLKELNLSDSNLGSLRSLGSGLMGLRVLWVSRNCLSNLDAINCFWQLQ